MSVRFTRFARVLAAGGAVLTLTVGCTKEQPGGDGAALAAPDAAAEGPAAAENVANKPSSPGKPAAGDPPKKVDAFEGEVKLGIDSGVASTDKLVMTLQVKGKKLRFDLEGKAVSMAGGVWGFIDVEKQQMYTAAPAQKIVVEMNLKKLGEQAGSFLPQGKESPEPMSFKKTDRKHTIAGKTCHDWEASSKQGDSQVVCLADLGASWFHFPTDGFALAPDFAKEMFDGAHFPLRVTTSAPGKPAAKMEVEKLTARPVADSVFQIPADYKVMNMDKMMGGVSGLMGQMGADANGPVDLKNLKMTPEMQEMMKKMQEQAAAASKQPAP